MGRVSNCNLFKSNYCSYKSKQTTTNTGNILNDTQAIFLDLKASGRLVGNFYPITGKSRAVEPKIYRN